MKHYVCLGGKFYIRYMYFDLNRNEDYIADSLFYKREIPIKFGNEMAREGDKYRIIFCKVRKKYAEKFEEALNEIPNKMELNGYLDYIEYCNDIINQMESTK